MRTPIRPPSPAIVLALIALIVALGATADALPGRNTIFTDDIRRDAVGRSEIQANGVARSELGPDSVGLSELREEGDADGGLTGAYVVESSLGVVPSAATADRAATAATADSARLASAIAPPEPFRVVGGAGNPPFLNGCTNVGGANETAAFFKDHEGIVHLRGLVACPGTSLTAFALPAGYRPAAGKVHIEISVVSGAPGGIGRVIIGGTAGDVAASASGQFGLDGIAFRAAS